METLLADPSWLIGGAGAVVAILGLTVFRRRYQRCPHCRHFVRRARRGWLRCASCGRQYHRSVPRQR